MTRTGYQDRRTDRVLESTQVSKDRGERLDGAQVQPLRMSDGMSQPLLVRNGRRRLHDERRESATDSQYLVEVSGSGDRRLARTGLQVMEVGRAERCGLCHRPQREPSLLAEPAQRHPEPWVDEGPGHRPTVGPDRTNRQVDRQRRDDPMRLFYDTEFLEDGTTIELISIGMVADDDRELYAVHRDAPWDRIREHPWLMANVVPHLPHRQDPDPLSLIDMDDPCVLPRQDIADRVCDFIQTTPEPQLWAWYGAYDHVALCQLFGRMIDLPACIPRWTNDVQTLLLSSPDARLPEQDGAIHNALGDAHHARALAAVNGRGLRGT